MAPFVFATQTVASMLIVLGCIVAVWGIVTGLDLIDDGNPRGWPVMLAAVALAVAASAAAATVIMAWSTSAGLIPVVP